MFGDVTNVLTPDNRCELDICYGRGTALRTQ
jgi:hypothetical protein